MYECNPAGPLHGRLPGIGLKLLIEALDLVKSGPPIGLGVGGSIRGDCGTRRLVVLDFLRNGLNTQTTPFVIKKSERTESLVPAQVNWRIWVFTSLFRDS